MSGSSSKKKEVEVEDVMHLGSCHCGAVKFKVYAAESPTVIRCK